MPARASHPTAGQRAYTKRANLTSDTEALSCHPARRGLQQASQRATKCAVRTSFMSLPRWFSTPERSTG